MNTIRSTWVGWGVLCAGTYLVTYPIYAFFIAKTLSSGFVSVQMLFSGTHISPAGGGAYYFAKKSIIADRTSRLEAELQRKALLKAMEKEHRQRAAISPPNPNVSDDSSFKPTKILQFQNAYNVAPHNTEDQDGPGPTRARSAP
ncbi:hypothetical protein N7450_011619 [Penicillium hetheringtonii]|uniref:Uncharacterized protein n=1 Tax=Penicillium hetheringtonii TaxID=911720 RepID=A0AAD6GM18_9EURO|nr:hypothetical protein N7450_011619 [Penicillium hetheringtonii]